MKKIIFVLSTMFISLCATAQNNLNEKAITWEAFAGMNFSKMDAYDSRVGFQLGVKGELALPSLVNGAYVNAGIGISQKGCGLDMGDLGDAKITAYYLDIPVHLGYKQEVNNEIALFGEVGPYFALGIGGKHKKTEYNGDGYDHYSTNTFDMFKRFDAGIGFRIGAEIKKKYSIALGYNFGLIDTWKGEESEEDEDEIDLTSGCKRKTFTISIGYKF